MAAQATKRLQKAGYLGSSAFRSRSLRQERAPVAGDHNVVAYCIAKYMVPIHTGESRGSLRRRQSWSIYFCHFSLLTILVLV